MVVLRDNSSPLVSASVLYIGSAAPLETAEGLEALQQPLRERYSVDNEDKIQGIDSTLSVSPDNIQLQYKSDQDRAIQFPIGSLVICAAVRCVKTVNGATGESATKFISLNDPLSGGPHARRPAIFACITRRTQGRKILECHGFICPSPKVALDLVNYTAISAQKNKQRESIKTQTQFTPRSNIAPTNDRFADTSLLTYNQDASTLSEPATTNRDSTMPSMHLIPAEPNAPSISAGPEFFGPVPTQGYFYSSDKAEVRTFNIERKGADAAPQYAIPENGEAHPTQIPAPFQHYPPMINGGPRMMLPPQPPPFARRIYVRQPMPMPVGPRVLMRPRFFSPPPRMRGPPMFMPMGAPPPIIAAPMYVRRPPRSHSSSRSHSEERSPDSRPRSPKSPDDNTEQKVPRGDADTSSDEGTHRPSTPPTDYDNRKGKRLSRRDEYDGGRRRRSPPTPYVTQPEAVISPYGYDYNIHPQYHGGYAPFAVYNPHGRSRSVPPQHRHRSKSRPKKVKKSRKSKKNAPNHRILKRHPIYSPSSDVSTDGYGGYHSEAAPIVVPVSIETGGYELYPPRDFRKNNKQYINEREFSRSIHEENRHNDARASYRHGDAYELNEAMGKLGASSKIAEDADFAMY